jgi:hypothetical protein
MKSFIIRFKESFNFTANGFCFRTRMKKYLSCPHLRKPSLVVYWLILGTIAFSTWRLDLWHMQDRIIKDDINHYYAYLPATFIYHDLKLDFVNSDLERFAKHFWPLRGPKGEWVMVTTMGLSIMYLPFFLLFYYTLEWMGYGGDAYTKSYQLAIVLSSIFYFAIGLMLLRKTLLKYYSEGVTALTLFAVVLATNLYYYVTDEPAMSHAYNFALLTAFLYYTLLWNSRPSFFYSGLLGSLAGLIALVRPTSILVVLVFIFWDVFSWKSFVDRLKIFLSRYYLLLVMILAAILVWVPQMLYWKYVTGHFLYFSYGDKGKFFFSSPQIISTLFGFRKGWLIYTPIMVFAFPGLFFLWKNKRALFTPVFIFMVFNIWVISSWWLWWYGGSYGLRAYIDSYGIIALPMAAILSWAFENRHVLIKSLIFFLLILFTCHNFFQIEQYHHGAIHYVSMTREAYWDSFGHLNPSPRFRYLLSYPDYKSAEEGIYPEPVLDPLYTGKLSREQGISVIEKELRSSDEQLKIIERKAKERGVPVDSMVRLDAIYVYDYKVEKGYILPPDH